MKLSEAIRLGAMLKPQGFGLDSVNWPVSEQTCAVGAALHAVSSPIGRDLFKVFPIARDLVVCPACNKRAEHGCCIVAHVNDVHRWSREQIADWVESIERTHEAQSPAAGRVDVVDDGREALPAPQIQELIAVQPAYPKTRTA